VSTKPESQDANCCDTSCELPASCGAAVIFNEQECDQLASFAKALGHPARVRILSQIMRCKGCVCGDLVDELGLAQSTVSQHIATLKQAGLITTGGESGPRCYCIVPEALRDLRVLVARL